MTHRPKKYTNSKEGREEGREQGMEEGREQGMEEGREQGMEEGREEIVKNLLLNTEFDSEKIAAIAGVPKRFVESIIRKL